MRGDQIRCDNDQYDLAALLHQSARLAWWNALPNRRKATFYDVWAGHLVRRDRFHRRMNQDLAQVFGLLAAGVLTPQVVARLLLTQAGDAMKLAESRTVFGKVVLIP